MRYLMISLRKIKHPCKGEKALEKNLMVTKGARLKEILGISKFVEDDKGNINEIDNFKTILDEKFKEYSNQGYRVLGVAINM